MANNWNRQNLRKLAEQRKTLTLAELGLMYGVNKERIRLLLLKAERLERKDAPQVPPQSEVSAV